MIRKTLFLSLLIAAHAHSFSLMPSRTIQCNNGRCDTVPTIAKVQAPEMDPRGALTAVSLLVIGVLVIRSYRRS